MSKIKHRLLNPKVVKCRCGIKFTPKNHAKKYHSEECRLSYAKDWAKEMRKHIKENNLCRCGVVLHTRDFKTCEDCRKERSIYQKERRIRLKQKEKENV